MKLGLGLPHHGLEATPHKIVEFAQRAEALGFDSLWAFERLLRAVEPAEGWRTPECYANVFAPVETLTYVAAHTSTIRLGTSVIAALFHVPVLLARRLATLDHLSAGRLVVGLGQGWSADEFATANVPMSAAVAVSRSSSRRCGPPGAPTRSAIRAVSIGSRRRKSAPNRCSPAARPFSSQQRRESTPPCSAPHG